MVSRAEFHLKQNPSKPISARQRADEYLKKSAEASRAYWAAKNPEKQPPSRLPAVPPLESLLKKKVIHLQPKDEEVFNVSDASPQKNMLGSPEVVVSDTSQEMSPEDKAGLAFREIFGGPEPFCRTSGSRNSFQSALPVSKEEDINAPNSLGSNLNAQLTQKKPPKQRLLHRRPPLAPVAKAKEEPRWRLSTASNGRSLSRSLSVPLMPREGSVKNPPRLSHLPYPKLDHLQRLLSSSVPVASSDPKPKTAFVRSLTPPPPSYALIVGKFPRSKKVPPRSETVVSFVNVDE